MIGVDGIFDLGEFPAEGWVNHGVLDESLSNFLEAAFAEGCAHVGQLSSDGVAAGVFCGSGPGGDEEFAVVLGVEGAVAIDTLDFNGGANFAVEFTIAMDVLDKVAVDTVHAFFEVDIEHVYGDVVFLGEELCFELADLEQELGVRLCPVDLALEILGDFRDLDGFLAFFGGGVREWFAGMIDGDALTIFSEDCLKHPAMTMEIGELGVFEFGVEL